MGILHHWKLKHRAGGQFACLPQSRLWGWDVAVRPGAEFLMLCQPGMWLLPGPVATPVKAIWVSGMRMQTVTC